jgi:histidine triad (HIT) family protein
MEPTLFTKIIRGEIPAHKIYEDDKTFAFLDIVPIQPGHVLVIPKAEVEFVWDLSDEDYKALTDTVKKIAKHMRETLSVKYVGEKIIGTDVPHAHIHLIPFNDSSEFFGDPNRGKASDEALAAVASRLSF